MVSANSLVTREDKSYQNTIVTHEEHGYRCKFLCCACGHIKGGSKVLAAVCLIASFLTMVFGSKFVNTLTIAPKATVAIVSFCFILYPVVLMLTSILVFFAIWKNKSVLVLPQVVAMMLQMLITIAVFIFVVCAAVDVTKVGMDITMQWRYDTHDYVSDSFESFGVKWFWVVLFTGLITLAISIPFCIVLAIQGTFIKYFLALKRFLADNQASMLETTEQKETPAV